ncbi:uncharacterized protein LOC106649050 [Trichogramma pretiosum]|uniref:uncharacterized protein LOC106649050 n=1 Tax=Trichogramma pretiosum TaxID=7493 RepID=UPI0006C95D71|nr:uncharacterized protein LOC106649050 [Trichogramma pretiosum]
MYCIIIPVLLPVTANFILPGNHTYAKQLSAHIELFLDEEIYFYNYFVMILITCYTAQVLISSWGIIYVSSAAYLVAKFRFMGFKLKQILILSEGEDFLEKNDEIFKHVSQLVQLHQYCINYCDVLNSITSRMFGLGTLHTIMAFVISGYVIVMEYERDKNLALKMFFVYILCSEFLLVTSHPSQMIFNSSGDIFETCYSTDWYKYSIKTRKMIHLILIRSSRPSCMKIGPSKYSNYETSGQLIRLSLSYIVSLMSINEQ